MTFLGMDVDDVDGLTNQLQTQLDRLKGVIGLVDNSVGTLGSLWYGGDLDHFQANWYNQRPLAQAITADLAAAIAHLQAEIGQQRAASDDSPGGVPIVGGIPVYAGQPHVHHSWLDRLKNGALHQLDGIGNSVNGAFGTMGAGLVSLAGGAEHGWNSFWDAEKKGWGTILTGAKNDGEQLLYDHPGVQSAIIQGLPWVLEGSAFGLSSVVPGGPALLAAATGGRWPTTDYQHAVGGLQRLGEDFGLLRDDPTNLSVNTVTSTPSHPLTNSPVQDLLEMEQSDGYGNNGTPQIGITTVHSPDGQTRYIVNIPGTEDWGAHRNGNVFDLTTNLQLMSGEPAAVTPAVEHAMAAAGVPNGADVMLVGHSQAGMTAMSIANDPNSPYHVNAILTAGAPTGQTPSVPSHTSVLSIEHNQDVVPRLDAHNNPAEPNWTTIKTNLDPHPIAKSSDPFAQAHDVSNYAQTAGDLQRTGQLDAWEQQNAQFLKGTPTGTKIVTIGK